MALATPYDIASLAEFFDTHDLASMAFSGSRVTSITGGQNGIVLPAPDSPLYDATGLNGYPCVITSNPWSRLEKSSGTLPAAMPTGSGACTVAVVMKGKADGYRGFAGYQDHNIGSVNGKPGIQVNGADLETSASWGANGNVFISTYAGGTNGAEKLYQDGTLIGSRTRTANTSGTFVYMGPNTNTGPFYISRLIFYSTELGTTDRQTLEGILAWAQGYEGQLPAGHPYKTAAPTTSTGYTLTAESGTFDITGQAATLQRARRLVAGAGSLQITGQPATLYRGYTLAAGAGDFSLDGGTAVLRVGRKIAAEGGSLALTGSEANLNVGGNKRLTASPGALSLTGGDAVLRVTRRLPAAGGSVGISGQATTLRYGRVVTAAGGALALNGQPATLTYVRHLVLVAEGGGLVLTGSPARLGLNDHTIYAPPLSGAAKTAAPLSQATATASPISGRSATAPTLAA